MQDMRGAVFFDLLECFLMLKKMAGSLSVLGVLVAFCLPGSASALTAGELKPALEQLLRENPDVFMNFLREHSEEILDIAQQGSNRRRQANMMKQWQKDRKIQKNVAVENRPTFGNSSAPVRIVAFSDFTCQFCQRAENTVAALLQEYEGKVSFVFKNMPLDPKGIGGQASQYFVAMGIIDEKKAWEFYRTLFENRDRLITEGEAFLRSTATKIGVDMKVLDKKRRSKAVADILAEDLKDAEKLKIEGTPYFLVNSLVVRGAIPKELFRKAIEMELNAPR